MLSCGALAPVPVGRIVLSREWIPLGKMKTPSHKRCSVTREMSMSDGYRFMSQVNRISI